MIDYDSFFALPPYGHFFFAFHAGAKELIAFFLLLIGCTKPFFKVLIFRFCSELEESLLVLPFSYVPDLLSLLNGFVKKSREIELVCRCIFFLMRY